MDMYVSSCAASHSERIQRHAVIVVMSFHLVCRCIMLHYVVCVCVLSRRSPCRVAV